MQWNEIEDRVWVSGQYRIELIDFCPEAHYNVRIAGRLIKSISAVPDASFEEAKEIAKRHAAEQR